MAVSQSRSRRVTGAAVLAIVLAQWFGTSLWFSPSGAVDGLSAWLGATPAQFGWLIAATQIGFICGTLLSAATGIADRFPPERIFIVSSLIGAGLNFVWTLGPSDLALVWISRFLVGISLAGIYPMGMKMIVKRAQAKSGQALAWLVAMLTLGTAMPQLLSAVGASLPWQSIMWGSSALAVLGSVLIAMISGRGASISGSGAARASAASAPSTTPRAAGEPALRRLFRDRMFRAAVFGYAGHMWELYAFWAVVPTLVIAAVDEKSDSTGLATTSFLVIAAGVAGCVLGGIIGRRTGGAAVAAVALAGSGLMCLVYPLLPDVGPILVAALALWGFLVIADSPQFSDLAARYAPAELTGTGLTVMNSLGFAVSVISIVVLQSLIVDFGAVAVWLLLPGPVLGLLAMRPLMLGRRAPRLDPGERSRPR
ncbi:MFS transporter [Brevibacterium marinum]|jgi:MFS family permease|uniref:MFS family permease n=1 Tax=Brevibacterium marinum TaxID=418643 RepID=A0A846SBJ1_9MICO|nr:MFS transporter [Brevibacterium marinum]NJC58632.1 MFS family permease [Brevibacterium marinum]